MVDTNLNYYNQNAKQFSESTLDLDMTRIYNSFLPLVEANGHILDAGCGSGRDSMYFKELGFSVTALDASEELVKIASNNIGQPVVHASFNEIAYQNEFDGIWCCASLLHVPQAELVSVFTKLSTALKYGAALYFSFKHGEGERSHNGRLFTDLNESGLEQLLNHFPEFQMSEAWISSDQRPGREDEMWLNAVVIKV